jgi:hypothetical protein
MALATEARNMQGSYDRKRIILGQDVMLTVAVLAVGG